jgi:hypothetical protein
MTPVFRLSGTIRGTEPVKASNIATWARNQVSCFMSRAGSTNAYRLKGRHPTNRYTVLALPVTGSASCIVGPDQSTSTVCPALCPTRDAAPVTRTCRW